MSKSNGYILHETADIVVIVTGTRRRTANVKTGNMLQVWILLRNVNPVEAIKTGEDIGICFDCAYRGKRGKGRKCYVQVGNAPLAVWKAYQRGLYPYLSAADYASVFQGRMVRFGAYGEPVLIPLAIVSAISAAADGHTGYTHQWRNPKYRGYSRFIMASADSVADRTAANLAGWRTFRVRTSAEPLLAREIACPASAEAGHRTTCADCELCNGTYPMDTRKDIVIIVHGAIAQSIVRSELIQIGA